MKKTKIIATVGPSIESEENLESAYRLGVNIIRFNFSHAQYDEAKVIVERIKKLNAQGKTNLSLLFDTKGPEIRTGDLVQKLHFSIGERVKIFVDASKKDEQSLFCDYPYLSQDMNIGDIIIIDSGLCRVKILEKHGDYVLVEMLNNAVIGSKRHINLPGVKLRLPGITPKDREDLLFAVENEYDFIAMSFVRNKENIAELREFLKLHNAEHIKIISKIENQEAIENLEEIIENSDGVMVARGDLGIEVPIEKLPFYQKKIANLCLKEGKFFIIATHLLETMIEQAFPTRAEVSDIYNSVMQMCDATMLSGETTTGKYPLEAIKMMSAVIAEAEKDVVRGEISFRDEHLSKVAYQRKVMIKHAISIGETLGAKALFIFTQFGFLPKIAAAHKPKIEMFAFTNNEKTFRFLNILYGVRPVKLSNFGENYSTNLDEAILLMKQNGSLGVGDKIVVVGDFQKAGKEYPFTELIEIE